MMRSCSRPRLVFTLGAASLVCAASAQTAPPLPETPAPSLAQSVTPLQPPPAGQPAISITLDEALSRARANEPTFAAAAAAAKNAALDRSIARAAVLPQVVYHNQYIYTEGARYAHAPSASAVAAGQPNTPGQQAFVANNGVHEYISQGSVTETLGLGQFNALSRASASAAIAKAELEIARRGLTVTVITLFYSSLAAGQKVASLERALDEANRFVTLTQQREAAREAAHADVIKAQLTQQQRGRDLADAKLAAEKARLDLGVLLFADPRTAYELQAQPDKPLDAQSVFEGAAYAGNPELRSALETVRQRSFDVTGAQTAYLPALSLNYLYGIDANQFAVNGRHSGTVPYDDATRNLGYSVVGTLDIPVFDWFATPNRIRQARNLRDAAKTVLSSAQRTLVAQLEEFYAEASVAHDQLDSLDLSVRTAEESLRLTRLRYTAGEATVLEVVDAQNSLTQAELARTDGQVRYHLSLANLQLLTGTI
jgi:outer membrane protein TolC